MATKTAKGFEIRCPLCQGEDSKITLDLNNLDSIECSECCETFSPWQARDRVAAELAKWERIVRMVEMAQAEM